MSSGKDRKPDSTNGVENLREEIENLRRANAGFIRLLENVDDILFRLRIKPDLKMEYISSAVERITGYSPKEICENPDLRKSIVHPEDHDLLEEYTASPENVINPISYRWITKNGDVIWTERKFSTIRNENGEVVALEGIIRDVTDQVRAEEEIKRLNDKLQRQAAESEDIFKAIFDSAVDSIFSKDMQRRYTMVNPAMEKLMGMPADQIIGKRADDLFDEEALVAIEQVDSAAFAGDEIQAVSTINIGSQTHSFHVLQVPLKDADGDIRGICGIVRDITEMNKVEQALRESEEKFRALTENSLDTIMRFDKEFRHLYVNPIVESQTNIPAADFIGKTHEDLGFPENLVQIWEKAIRKVFDTGKAHRIEFQLPTGIWIDWFLVPEFDQDKKVKAVITSARDITERKHYEQELLAKTHAIRSALNGIAMGDQYGNLTFVNPAFLKIWGYEEEDVLGRHASEFWQDSEKAKMIIESLADTGKWFGEMKAVTRDKRQISLLVSASTIMDESNMPVGIMASFVDISEQKKSLQEKQILEKRLFQAQKMETIGTLAGGIAHDVNNILQTIFNNTHLIRDDVSGKESSTEAVENILKAGRRAKSLVEQILTFSREVEHVRQPVRIYPLVKEVIKMLQSTVDPKISVVDEVDTDTGAIMADQAQIHQVVMNLATNAVQAIPEQGGTITIGLTKVEVADIGEYDLEPGPYLKLSVEDTGLGMDPKTMSRIFEPFFTTKEVGKGTGLGLSVTHGIVVSHGGTITVNSRVGGGTMFEVLFPMAKKELADQKPSGLEPRGGREKIMFVEDDEEQARLGKLLLEKEGYKIISLTDGEQALKLFEKAPDEIDLVVLDYMMPETTGVDVARKMMEIKARLPIVLITGKADEATINNASDAGIDKVVSKPFDPDQLTGAIRELLDNH